jgi:hypothetical protein
MTVSDSPFDRVGPPSTTVGDTLGEDDLGRLMVMMGVAIVGVLSPPGIGHSGTALMLSRCGARVRLAAGGHTQS